MLAALTAWRLGPHVPPLLPEGGARAAGAALVAAGLLLDGWSFASHARAGSTPIPGERGALVERGPYRWVRNPIYWAHAAVATGAGLLLSRSLVAPPLAAFALLATHRWTVAFEESELRAAFGDAFEDYARRVPRWLPRARRVR